MDSRLLIADLLGSMHASRSPRIVLVLRPQDNVPDWVDSIIEMSTQQAQRPAYIGPRNCWTAPSSFQSVDTSKNVARRKVAKEDAPEVIKLVKANVRYQDRKILEEISWVLNQGDRVALTGANGEANKITRIYIPKF